MTGAKLKTRGAMAPPGPSVATPLIRRGVELVPNPAYSSCSVQSSVQQPHAPAGYGLGTVLYQASQHQQSVPGGAGLHSHHTHQPTLASNAQHTQAQTAAVVPPPYDHRNDVNGNRNTDVKQAFDRRFVAPSGLSSWQSDPPHRSIDEPGGDVISLHEEEETSVKEREAFAVATPPAQQMTSSQSLEPRMEIVRHTMCDNSRHPPAGVSAFGSRLSVTSSDSDLSDVGSMAAPSLSLTVNDRPGSEGNNDSTDQLESSSMSSSVDRMIDITSISDSELNRFRIGLMGNDATADVTRQQNIAANNTTRAHSRAADDNVRVQNVGRRNTPQATRNTSRSKRSPAAARDAQQHVPAPLPQTGKLAAF